MKTFILDESISDERSLECRNFAVVGLKEDVFICKFSYIQKHFPEVVRKIREALAEGRRHIGFLKDLRSAKDRNGTPLGISFGETHAYCEIQWE
jgi:hypothetical protein